jgi:hypothetical protein
VGIDGALIISDLTTYIHSRKFAAEACEKLERTLNGLRGLFK